MISLVVGAAARATAVGLKRVEPMQGGGAHPTDLSDCGFSVYSKDEEENRSFFFLLYRESTR